MASKLKIFKICILGNSQVGKSALVAKFLNNEFLEEEISTIVDKHVSCIVLDNNKYNLEIIDTGGNYFDENEYIYEEYIQESNGFFLVFNVTDYSSFQILSKFIDYIKTKSKNKYAMIVVGTHIDLQNKRKVTQECVYDFVYNYSCKYIEISSKTGENIELLFQEMVRQVRDIYIEESQVKKTNQTKIKKKEKGTVKLSHVVPFDRLRGLKEKKKDKEKNETTEKDNDLSIVKDPQRRKELCELLPELKIIPLLKKKEIICIHGPPEDELQQNFKDYVSARSVSTYPIKQETKVREGDPICDQYYLVHFANRTFVALADGCNWGEEPKRAAKKASEAFIEYFRKHQKNIQTIRDIGNFMLKAYSLAHNIIIEGRTEENIFQAGTTTMIGGVLVQIEGSNNWAFVSISLGDCKAYKWDYEVIDITEGNRGNITDARDPGGRLGPYLEGGLPDLRNLMLFYTPCNEGDIIIVVSDGVHDNFDPEYLGKSPKDIGLNLNKWEDLTKNKKDSFEYLEAEKKKKAFSKNLIKEILFGNKTIHECDKLNI